MKVKETVSDEAREDQWGVRSIDKVQHTETTTVHRVHGTEPKTVRMEMIGKGISF